MAGGRGIEGDPARRAIRILVRVVFGIGAVWLFAFFLLRVARGSVIRCPPSIFARGDLFAIADALAWFAEENDGSVPSELSVLWKPDSRGFRYIDIDGPLLDPWDRPYLYEPPSDAVDSFRVFSLGEDGRPGGEGEDADLEIVRAR